MKKNLHQYGQYKHDIFQKLDYDFIAGKKILDVGCGDGSDAQIFTREYNLDTYGIDVIEDEHVRGIEGLKFTRSGIEHIPFEDNIFDYVFLHDILHHIDEERQSQERHIRGLHELQRVCKPGGTIIIVEANRFNPIFYPHMVLTVGHNHFRQKYFKKIVRDVFPYAVFKFFESHSYPKKLLAFFKVYEGVIEAMAPKKILAYNVAIINKPL